MAAKKKSLRSITPYFLVIPALLVFTVMVTIPLLQNIRYSFTEWDGVLSEPRFIGLDNYVRIFTNPPFYKALAITFEMTAIIVVFQQAEAIFLAVMVKENKRINNFFRSLFFVPSLLTTVSVALIFSYIFNVNFGIFNLLLGKLGLTGLAALDWLGDPVFAPLMCAFTAVWQYSGYNMIIYLGSLKSISDDYYESADLDGASPWKKFTKITFPLIAPALTVNTLITVISCLRFFDIPYLLTKGGPGDASQTILMLIYKDAFYGNQAGVVAAESFILLLIVMAVSVIQSRYLTAREVDM